MSSSKRVTPAGALKVSQKDFQKKPRADILSQTAKRLAARTDAVITAAGLDGGAQEEDRAEEEEEDGAQESVPAADEEERKGEQTPARNKASALLREMAARIRELEAKTAHLEEEARQTAETAAMRAEEEEDTGEQGDETEQQAEAIVTSKPPGGPTTPSAQVLRVMQIPLPARPTTLTYEKVEATVETWCKQQRAWFRAAHIQDGEEQVVQAIMNADHLLQSWWESRAESTAAASSFDVLEATLLATFVRKDAAERARAQLRDLRMTQAEDAHKYFLRVEELRVKARVADDDVVVLEMVFDRFDQSRWPLAYAQAAEELRARRITRISALHEFLANKVLCEPKWNRPAQAPQSKGAQGRPPARLNAMGVEEPQAEDSAVARLEAQLAKVTMQLSALQEKGPQSSGGNCFRCKKPGHSVGECKAQDMRICYRCQKKGHISRSCPESIAKSAAAAAAAASAAPPKNE